jgi:hypothetical protein
MWAGAFADRRAGVAMDCGVTIPTAVTSRPPAR